MDLAPGAVAGFICSLRSAGIEVWFGKSELRGGDAWDRQIREQIHDCRLFIAVISSHTEARDGGYFRREWRLAIERAGDMAEDKAFVVPVAIDGTSERSARLPDPFKHLQWTRLAAGEVPAAFVERIRKLLSPAEPDTRAKARPQTDRVPLAVPVTSRTLSVRPRSVLVAIAAVAAVGLTYILVEKVWFSRRRAATVDNAAPLPAAPEKSIAVLPFVDFSEKHDQQYFSDGLSVELIDLLRGSRTSP